MKTIVITGGSKGLGVDAAPFGFRTNAVCPGFIDTDMTRAILEKDPARREKIEGRIPGGRFGTARNVADGADLAPGQLVALNPVINCGDCANCKRGEVSLCTAKRFPGSATTVPHIDGFFRDYFDFPAFCRHPLPEGTDPDHLTFAEPLACSMHAVNLGGVGSESRVCVTGCGPMGLLAVVAAAAKGAHVEVTDHRGTIPARPDRRRPAIHGRRKGRRRDPAEARKVNGTGRTAQDRGQERPKMRPKPYPR